MKKITFLCLLSIFAITGFSQNEKYIKTMQDLVPAVDTTRSPAALQILANKFERIAEAEKNQWLPYYYAALTTTSFGYTAAMPNGTMNADPAVTDPVADKATALLNKAEALSKDNSEIYVVRKMIASLRVIADPMNRWQTDGAAAAEALNQAKQLNQDNPRVYILEAQDKFFTPEQYGGSKTEAKKLFETAVQKFDTFKPESPIAPNWGLSQAKYFLSQM